MVSSWSSCRYSSDCDESGSMERTKTDFECRYETCERLSQAESRSCNRGTDGKTCGNGMACGNGKCVAIGLCGGRPDGTSCGTTVVSTWSSCSGFSNVCDQTGSQSRNVVNQVCSSNDCVSEQSSESRSCTRNTDGDSCGRDAYCNAGGCVREAPVCSGTDSSCGSSSCTNCDNSDGWVRTGDTRNVKLDVCSSRSEHEEEYRDYYCSGISCQYRITSSRWIAGSVTQTNNGATCRPTTYGSWSSCGSYSSTCDETGTHSRSITSYACGNGNCLSSRTTERGSCTRDTDGTSCGTNKICTRGSCVYVGGGNGGGTVPIPEEPDDSSPGGNGNKLLPLAGSAYNRPSTLDPCDRCGQGFFNRCDLVECLSLGECVYFDSILFPRCEKI
ncbi:MAG: hypothetical protein ABIC95_01940 [archaeon]